MHTLDKTLTDLGAAPTSSVPVIFDLSKEIDQAEFEKLVQSGAIKQITDDYEEEQKELFGIRNPSHVYTPTFKQEFADYFEALKKEKPLWQDGRWVYFPWRYLAAHILPEEEYRLVRTARNQNLITKEEQDKFYNAKIGIGGLSVGSSVAFALVLQGGAKYLKLADMDRLALTNTNRILAGVDRLGMLKVEMAARTIYELNPYAEIDLYPDGITEENIASFFEGLDVVIDELDNLAVKYLMREHARKNKVPLVTAADNGDNGVLDVERYDLNPETPFFHGRMGEVSYQMLKTLDKFGIGRLITKWVGAENVTERMQGSLKEMGKTIVSWPQLGGAALLNGAAVAFCVRNIVNDLPLNNDRALILLDEKLVPEYNSEASVAHRKSVAEAFAKIFGL